jgi:hypothetical protein
LRKEKVVPVLFSDFAVWDRLLEEVGINALIPVQLKPSNTGNLFESTRYRQVASSEYKKLEALHSHFTDNGAINSKELRERSA